MMTDFWERIEMTHLRNITWLFAAVAAGCSSGSIRDDSSIVRDAACADIPQPNRDRAILGHTRCKPGLDGTTEVHEAHCSSSYTNGSGNTWSAECDPPLGTCTCYYNNVEMCGCQGSEELVRQRGCCFSF